MSDVTKPIFWSIVPGGVRVAVRVQPRARKAGVQGIVASADGPRLRIAVCEPPEDGKASKAACAALAEALQIAPSVVQLVMGASSREKLLFVAGDPAAVIGRLEVMG